MDAQSAPLSGHSQHFPRLVVVLPEGIGKDGKRFPRPGRGTAIFGRAQTTGGWRAVHTHFSLNRGVPQQSYGERPERA